MKEIKILFENAINKYITSSDKAKFENKDILHHPIIIAYPLHKKDSSIVFKRLKYIIVINSVNWCENLITDITMRELSAPSPVGHKKASLNKCEKQSQSKT